MILNKNFLMCSIGGMLLGTLGDQFHLVSNTLGYPDHYGFYLPHQQPFWVPALMFTAGVALYIGHGFFQQSRFYDLRASSFIKGNIIAASYFIMHSLSGFIPKDTSFLPTFVLLLLTIIIALVSKIKFSGILFSIFGSIVGVLAESFLVNINVFYYTKENLLFLGVPAWLGCLYFVACLGTYEILESQKIVKVEVNHESL